MYYSKFFIPTSKQVPKDTVIQSHILMIRAGLIKKLAGGIYSLLPLGNRVVKKVENIIREEMDRIGGSEFVLPVLIPGELWKMSSRWRTMGPELYRLKDRNQMDFVLAPTHEEVFTQLLKEHIKSYRDLPLLVYQIGLKFRDEIRPRFGVMRAKSFIMKDAYSFHSPDEPDSMDRTYNQMCLAYRRVFKRCGLETIPVAADSGAMGGAKSEEFMVPAEVGEEEIIRCSKCSYRANREKAVCKNEEIQYKDRGEVALVETPGIKTIDALSGFMEAPSAFMIKTLVYRTGQGNLVLVLIRGDLELNETKLKNYLGETEIYHAQPEESLQKLGIPLGFAGPVGVDSVHKVADLSIRGMKGVITGANRENYHYKNINEGRDFQPDCFTDLRLVNKRDKCPHCGASLEMFKGIELGHVFKLGDKYTKAFGVSYVDENETLKTPLMGCYGIGVERTVAAVIEQNHDHNGIIWPMSIAPFQVYILPIKYTGRIKEVCNNIKDQLEEEGLEAIVDDRPLRPGVKFMDADLIGIPFRITIGDKGLKNNQVELVERKTAFRENIPVSRITSVAKQKVQTAMNELQ
ncbi:MAG: proline--tRNA ligase [Spirochaetota bacterium]